MRIAVVGFAVLLLSAVSSYADFHSNSVETDGFGGVYRCKHVENNSVQLGFTNQFSPSSEAIVGVTSSGMTLLLPGGGSFVAHNCDEAGQQIFCSNQNYTLSMNEKEKLFSRSIKVKTSGGALSKLKEVWSCNSFDLHE